MAQLSRRQFLEATGAAVGLSALTLHCSDDTTGMPVGIVGRPTVEAAVRRAVELAGGLGAIGPGKTVFIKPNAVYPSTLPGITTSPEVLAAVVKVVKERSPQRIVVGDRSARGFDSAATFAMTGLGPAALAAGADEVYPAPAPTTDPTAWMLMQPPHYEDTWSATGGILAMRKILESDYLISVPVVKNHRYAAYSISMKLYIGGIGDSSRDILHYNLGGDPGQLGRDIAVLNQIFHPLLTIADGWTALINGGPQGMPPDRVATTPHLIFASPDRLALDAAAVSLIKLELSRNAVPMPDQSQVYLSTPGGPWSLPQLVHGAELGLGVRGPGQVSLQFDGVADAAAIQGRFDSVPAAPDGG
jgi:uncharacterized protein (DUF362 family)